MKNKKALIAIICCTVVVVVAAAILLPKVLGGKKDTYDYRANLPGKYVVYHWFYDVKNGDSGFYDDSAVGHYNFGADGAYSHTGGDLAEGESQTGTYAFTADNVIRITLEDGSFDDLTLRYSTNHNSTEMTNNVTKFAVSLQADQ